MPDNGNQNSILVAKHLKLAAFMSKLMGHCSKSYGIRYVNSRTVLDYQHQWELEQKKTDDLEVPKVDKNKWAKTMENIVLHLKLMSRVSGAPVAYLVQHHIKVTLISSGNGVYLNLDEGRPHS